MKKRYLSLLLALSLLAGGIPAERVYAANESYIMTNEIESSSDEMQETELIIESQQEETNIEESEETIESIVGSTTTEEETTVEESVEESIEESVEESTEETEGSDEIEETKEAAMDQQKRAEQELAAYEALEESAGELLEKLKQKYPDVAWVEGTIYEYTDEYGVHKVVDIYDPELYKVLEDTEEESIMFDDLDLVTASDDDRTISPYTGGVYHHGIKSDEYLTRNGIDVSYHQTAVDWNAVKSTGASFAFIRIGFRGYGKDGTVNEDTKGVEYVNGAYNAGLKVGVYFYSQAISDSEAREEARFCVNFLNKYNLNSKVSLPIVMDYEYSDDLNGRLRAAKLSAEVQQKICDGFGNEINELGQSSGRNYKPMIYASYDMLKNHLKPSTSPDYINYWIARYNNQTGYTGKYDFWQYSSKGSVKGIAGNVDCNFWYEKKKKITDPSVLVSLPAKCDYINYAKENLIIYDTEFNKKLKENVDYQVDYFKTTGSNIYEFQITGIGNYIKSFSRKVELTTMALESNMVAKIPDQIYTGQAIDDQTGVSVVLTHDGKTLTKGQDYTYTFSNNIQVGQASVTVIGMGRYTGTVTKKFNIVGKTIKEEWIETIPDQIFRGAEFRNGNGLSIVVKDDNANILVENQDYKLTYKNNKKVGKATVTVAGLQNYSGKVNKTFLITKDSLGEGTFELPENMQVLVGGVSGRYVAGYTGKSIKPSISIVKNGRTLTKSDYSVSYQDNTNIGDQAVIIIKGKGGYQGSSKIYFTIDRFAPVTKLNSKMVSLTESFYLYDGKEWKPDAVVICNGKQLQKDVDYQIIYQDKNKREITAMTEIGTYKMVITGINQYTGSVTKQISVKKPNPKILLSRETIQTTVEPTEGNQIIYTGQKIKPVVVVTSKTEGGKVLVEKTDYTIQYSNNENAGTAKYVITGKGNYTGSFTGTFVIDKREIGNTVDTEGVPLEIEQGKFSLKKYVTVFNGKKQKPGIVAKYGKKTLKLNTDYLVDYSDANFTEAGKYTVKLTFHGNLTGTVVMPYEIQPADLSKVSISIPKQYYQGKPVILEPKDVVFKLKGVKLTPEMLHGVSFTDWQNHVEVSTSKEKASALCIAASDSNFIAGSNKLISFSINRKPIGDSKLVYTIGGLPVVGTEGSYEVVYDGTAHNASNGAVVSITDTADGRSLVEGVDYKCKYTSNTNAGKAKITVTGMGKYSGSKMVTFWIRGNAFEQNGTLLTGYEAGLIKDKKVVDQPSYVFKGSSHKPTVKFTYQNKELKNGKDYTVKYVNNVNVGTATAIITGKGNYVGTITRTFQITRKTVTKTNKVSVSGVGRQKYQNKVIVPDVTVKVDGITLKKGVDYTVSVINCIPRDSKQKQWLATIIITGVGNYEGAIARVPFVVYKE